MVFDFRDFQYRVGNDIDLLRIIIVTFVEEMPQKIKQLEFSLKNNNANESHLIAHTIKGLAVNVSAINISKEAKTIERFCKEKNCEWALQKVESLKDEYKKFVKYVEHIMHY